MSGPMREMTPEEIAAGIVSRKRPRKWLANDLNAIIERSGRRAVLALDRAIAAIEGDRPADLRAAAKLLCDYTGSHKGPCVAHLHFAADHYAPSSADEMYHAYLEARSREEVDS